MMPPMIFALPLTAPSSTLGAMLGPIAVLAVLAVLVTLGVLVAGVVTERRAALHRERMRRAGAPHRPEPVGRPVRDAA